jgi:mannose-6-phosphate isomerase-like protein (cupin superfamily)
MTQVLLRSEQTGGVLSVVESTVPGDFPGPFLHTHEFDETFCVLDGELTFQLGDELITLAQGEVAFAARGVPHTYANLSGAPARQLIICTPAGFERYFARMVAQRAGADPPEWALQPLPEVIRVGPRIGERAGGPRG